MPRLINRPPKHRLHKPSGQAIVSLDGARLYLGVYGTPESHERYQSAIAEWTSRRGDGKPPKTAPKPPERPRRTAASIVAELHQSAGGRPVKKLNRSKSSLAIWF